MWQAFKRHSSIQKYTCTKCIQIWTWCHGLVLATRTESDSCLLLGPCDFCLIWEVPFYFPVTLALSSKLIALTHCARCYAIFETHARNSYALAIRPFKPVSTNQKCLLTSCIVSYVCQASRGARCVWNVKLAPHDHMIPWCIMGCASWMHYHHGRLNMPCVVPTVPGFCPEHLCWAPMAYLCQLTALLPSGALYSYLRCICFVFQTPQQELHFENGD